MSARRDVPVLGLSLGLLIGIASLATADVDARDGRGGGGMRATARTSVNHAGSRPGQMDRGGGGRQAAGMNRGASRPGQMDRSGGGRQIDRNTTRNRNTNVNRNINIERDIDVDIDVHHDWHDDWYHDHPIATAAAITTAAVVTARAIGSIVYSVPPSCVTRVYYNVAYTQCGDTWYQPQYVGTTVQYIVVNPPN